MAMLQNRLLPVVIGVAALIGAANIGAYAAGGQPLLLGHANAETKTAAVANSGTGPALSLRSSHKSPSLAVSSSKLVKHLNANDVDGLSAADLQTRAITWTLPADNVPNAFELTGLKEGTYFASVSVLVDEDATAACNLFENATELLVYGANRMGSVSMVSGGNIFDYGGGVLTLSCDGDLDPLIENTVTMIRLSHVVHKTAQEPLAGVRARLQLPTRP